MAGLLGRWGLNEGSRATAGNSVSGSASGTLTNGPTWFPPGTPFLASVTIQEGLNSYAGTLDTYLQQVTPTTAHGTEDNVGWNSMETTSPSWRFGLLQFTNIFVNSPVRIPPNATIASAYLDYYVNDTGDSANVNEVLVDWNESTTFNSFGVAPGVDPSDYGTRVGAAMAGTADTFSVNVTSSLTAWAANPALNKGWLFRPSGTSGVYFYSSEYTTAGLRPLLRVTHNYNPPVVPDIPVAIPATTVIFNGFTANWNAVSGATGYRLDVSTDAGFGSYVPGYEDLVVGGLVGP